MTMITRDDQIPRPKNVLWVECLKASESGNFVIYSPQIQGVWTHWTGSKTLPCYHDHTKCFKGHDGESRRWYGYLHAFSYRRNKPVFLQLPAGSAFAFFQQYKEGTLFRGKHITATRGAGKKTPIVITENVHLNRKGDDLPPPRDCIQSVLHTWKIYEVDLAVDNRLVKHLDEIPVEDAA